MFGQANRFFPGALFVATGAVVLGVSSPAPADTIEISADIANSTDALGNFTGFLTYDFVLGDLGVLTVELTNTSELSNGGWITGFIFNFDTTDPDAYGQFEKGTYPFVDAPGQNGEPFGPIYMAGAALGGNWIDGGFPEDGIAVGHTGVFGFEVIAKDAADLTASSFLDGPYQLNFIVRFRGFVDGNSDMVPAVPTPGTPCPWDLDGSSDVGVKDLLILLGVWGPCPPKGDCPADFDGSSDVGVKDLLILLGVWGPCP